VTVSGGTGKDITSTKRGSRSCRVVVKVSFPR
jgi:hypothetical protein